VPLVANNFDVYPIDLFAAASDYAIESNIVLKGIGADNVVVVGVGNSNCNATSLVYAARNRLEFKETSTFFATIGSKIASGKR
jgi:hypothetical protein